VGVARVHRSREEEDVCVGLVGKNYAGGGGRPEVADYC